MFLYVNEYLWHSWLICVLAKSTDQGRHGSHHQWACLPMLCALTLVSLCISILPSCTVVSLFSVVLLVPCSLFPATHRLCCHSLTYFLIVLLASLLASGLWHFVNCIPHLPVVVPLVLWSGVWRAPGAYRNPMTSLLWFYLRCSLFNQFTAMLRD